MIRKDIFNFLLAVLAVFAISCNKDNDKSSDNPPCPNIAVKIYGDTIITPGDTLNLYATLLNGAEYSWTGPQGFTSSQTAVVIPAVTSLQSGLYIITANVNGICVTEPDTFLVTVNCDSVPIENVHANYYSPVTTGGQLQLFAESNDSVSYTWTGPAGFTSALQNPVIPAITAGNSGTYIVYAYKGFCYSNADSVVVNFAECNPSPNTFAKAQGGSTFFYSFGSNNMYSGTRSLTGLNSDGTKSLIVTFPGTAPAAGTYTVSAAHCPAPPTNGTLLSTECCIQFIDTTGTYVGVSGTVSLTGLDAMHFCTVPFKLQSTTTTLFNASGNLDY